LLRRTGDDRSRVTASDPTGQACIAGRERVMILGGMPDQRCRWGAIRAFVMNTVRVVQASRTSSGTDGVIQGRRKAAENNRRGQRAKDSHRPDRPMSCRLRGRRARLTAPPSNGDASAVLPSPEGAPPVTSEFRTASLPERRACWKNLYSVHDFGRRTGARVAQGRERSTANMRRERGRSRALDQGFCARLEAARARTNWTRPRSAYYVRGQVERRSAEGEATAGDAGVGAVSGCCAA